MQTASGFDLFFHSVASGARHAVFDLGPWILVWLMIASPFLWLVARMRKTRRSIAASVTITACLALVVVGVCAVVHFVFAFGEAWDGGIDRDRVRAFVALTVAFVVFSTFLLRGPSPRKNA